MAVILIIDMLGSLVFKLMHLALGICGKNLSIDNNRFIECEHNYSNLISNCHCIQQVVIIINGHCIQQVVIIINGHCIQQGGYN